MTVFGINDNFSHLQPIVTTRKRGGDSENNTENKYNHSGCIYKTELQKKIYYHTTKKNTTTENNKTLIKYIHIIM